MTNPILFAVPVFLLLMALEFANSRRLGQPVYRTADTVTSLSLGIISQLVGLFAVTITVGIYTQVYQRWALWQLPVSQPLVWLGALLAYDFCYYWLHRMGHEVGVLWAAHVVHHSSEDYNLGTALRQTGTGFLLGWLFYLPMALVGVPPLVLVAVGLIDLLYQFWVHTQQVGQLGWFDRVFVSPSNHRVHHGQNDYCLDRNYGGILILWDRLFGTFEPERPDEPIVYGIRGQLGSFSPVRANTHVYAALWFDSRHAASWADKLRVWFKPPGWRPADVAVRFPKPAYDISRFQRLEAPLPPALQAYVWLQFAGVLALALHALAVAPTAPLPLLAADALAITVQLWAITRLCERGWAAQAVERGRLLMLGVLLALSPLHSMGWLLLPAFCALAWGVLQAKAHQAA